MKQKDTKQGKDTFQTHIAEPRWQQVVSVIAVAVLVVGWIVFSIWK